MKVKKKQKNEKIRKEKEKRTQKRNLHVWKKWLLQMTLKEKKRTKKQKQSEEANVWHCRCSCSFLNFREKMGMPPRSFTQKTFSCLHAVKRLGFLIGRRASDTLHCATMQRATTLPCFSRRIVALYQIRRAGIVSRLPSSHHSNPQGKSPQTAAATCDAMNNHIARLSQSEARSHKPKDDTNYRMSWPLSVTSHNSSETK